MSKMYQRLSWKSEHTGATLWSVQKDGGWLCSPFTVSLSKLWLAFATMSGREPLVKTAPSASAGKSFFKKTEGKYPIPFSGL